MPKICTLVLAKSFALFLATTIPPLFLPSWLALSSHFPLPKTLHSSKQFQFFVKFALFFGKFALSNGVTGIRSSKTNDRISGCTVLLLIEKWIKLIPKTIGNRKRDCERGCARGINTTWENLQIEKHKSGRCSFQFHSPDWFVLFDLQIFSGGVYPPSATSRTISFSISNSFWH